MGAPCVRKEVLKVKLLKVGMAASPQRPRAAHSMAVRLRPHHALGEGAVQEAPVCCVGKKVAPGRRRRRWEASCVRKEVLKVNGAEGGGGSAAPKTSYRSLHGCTLSPPSRIAPGRIRYQRRAVPCREEGADALGRHEGAGAREEGEGEYGGWAFSRFAPAPRPVVCVLLISPVLTYLLRLTWPSTSGRPPPKKT